jgi:Dyp-type peroxidase family
MTRLETSDIQGNVVSAYRTTHARYLFFTFEQPRIGLNGWLSSLQATPQSEKLRYPDVSCNVAFTATGLAKAGVPGDILQYLPVAFRSGMQARSAILGDLGESHPRTWENWCREADIDLLITITGWSDAACQSLEDEIHSHPGRPRLLRAETATALLDSNGTLAPERIGPLDPPTKAENLRYEAFGFRDGLSNPTIEGSDRRLGSGSRTLRRLKDKSGLEWHQTKPGEFLLGYEDETRQIDLPSAAARYLRNGTYVVWRKLLQDVEGFGTKYAEADRPSVVGRAQNGCPLATHRPRTEGWDNDFIYGNDPPGVGCPPSAHIRRANPRDALDFAESVVGRHRLIRRGMPYQTEDGAERGLIFVCFNADLERQYEFVQQHWINSDPSRPHLQTPDPIATPNQGGDGLKTFVTTRAGEYFFQPGRLGLRAIAGSGGIA